MSETYGQIPLALFVRYNPASRSWRMSQASWADTDTSDTYSGSWPKAGLMLCGMSSPPPPSEPDTSEIDSGCLPDDLSDLKVYYLPRLSFPTHLKTRYGVFPQPSALERYLPSAEGDEPSPDDDRQMWMTPNTFDAITPKSQEVLDHEATHHRKGRATPNNLRDQINVAEGYAEWKGQEASEQVMFPTPAATSPGDGDTYLSSLTDKDGGPPAPNQRVYNPKTGLHAQVTLNRYVKLFAPEELESTDGIESERGSWSTPRAHDWKGADLAREENRSGARHAGDDLATAVERDRITTVGMFTTPKTSPSGPDFARENREGSRGDDLVTQVAKMDGSAALLNPDWVEWLMGWPIGWTSTNPLPQESIHDWKTKTLDATWWDSEPDVPRVTTEKGARVSRLKALGNGQVSLCAAAACVALFETFQRIDTVSQELQEDRSLDWFGFIGYSESR